MKNFIFILSLCILSAFALLVHHLLGLTIDGNLTDEVVAVNVYEAKPIAPITTNKQKQTGSEAKENCIEPIIHPLPPEPKAKTEIHALPLKPKTVAKTTQKPKNKRINKTKNTSSSTELSRWKIYSTHLQKYLSNDFRCGDTHIEECIAQSLEKNLKDWTFDYRTKKKDGQYYNHLVHQPTQIEIEYSKRGYIDVFIPQQYTDSASKSSGIYSLKNSGVYTSTIINRPPNIKTFRIPHTENKEGKKRLQAVLKTENFKYMTNNAASNTATPKPRNNKILKKNMPIFPKNKRKRPKTRTRIRVK